jgi:O-acetyl-ADP-ribose deacetylase (regulator of RNase III)
LSEALLEQFCGGRVSVVVGDITEQRVDAIVNAANSTLLGGGGVDGAIHRAGGPGILEECKLLRRTFYPNGLPTGEAVITTGGELPARFVIHAVGPVYGTHGGREAELLSSCYTRSLRLALEHGAQSIAFPAISTGVYGYPREYAAAIASESVKSFLAEQSGIAQVIFVFFQANDATVFLENHKF